MDEFINNLIAIAEKADDTTFEALRIKTIEIDPTGEFADKLQFRRQWVRNEAFRNSVKEIVRNANGIA